MINFILEYWYLIVIGLCVSFVIGYNLNKFMSLPTAEKTKNIIQWLIWACSEAEKKYGSNTGRLKLQEVWALFVSTFPSVANVISYEKFSGWVDEALDELKVIAENNQKIKEAINPDMNTITSK